MNSASIVAIIGWVMLLVFWTLMLSGVDMDEKATLTCLGIVLGLFTANIIRGK